MSETTSEQSTEADQQQGDPVDGLGEGGQKALKAEREARKVAEQAASALQKQLDDINAANLTDLEKAQKQASDAQSEIVKARAEAARFRVAAKHGISDEDAELFLTGSDAETLERQAARLMERAPTSPKPDPSQGARGGDAPVTTGQQFASFIEGSFSN